MKLSVIIVSYNVKHYLEQCLRSVFRSASGIDLEVFVVDNDSHDATPQYLHEQFSPELYPQLHVIANHVNVGYGKANNQALGESRGDYVLFLNPDTLLSDSCLPECLRFMEQHPEAGAVGVRMLRPDGSFAPESRRGLPTPFTAFCKFSGLSRLLPRSRVFGRYYMSYLDASEVCPIDVVSGAFMMVPRAVLSEVGGFDEDFFMYGEDIDLSYRILKSGRQNYYLPLPILHYKGESTEKTSYRYVYVFYEAMLIFFNKHYRHYGLLLSLPVKAAIFLFGTYAYFKQQFSKLGSRPHAWSSLPQHRYLFVGSAAMLEQARQLSKRWMLSADYVEGTELSLPEGHLASGFSEEDYRFVVYDMQSYTTDALLRIFDGRPSAHALIGTFYPDRHLMITNRNIFI
ncbi:MAG: glycosyltransferase family 2 protein [Bacteroidaceae bacterium]|nr:glycosyltransferase family 2 protein [Bacteroidaceae bacterium]